MNKRFVFLLTIFSLLCPATSAAELQFDLKSISESRALYKDSSGDWKKPVPGSAMTLPQILSTIISFGVFYDKEAGKDRQLLRLLFFTDDLLPAEGWEFYKSNVKLHSANDDQGNALKIIKGHFIRNSQSASGLLNITLHITSRASKKIHLSGDAELIELSKAESVNLILPGDTGALQDDSLQRYAIKIHYHTHRKGSFTFPEYPLLRFKVSGDITAFRTLRVIDADGKNLQKGESQFNRIGANELLVNAHLWKPLGKDAQISLELGKKEFRTQRGSFSAGDVPLP